MTDEGRLDDQRRGFWLWMARERAGLKQGDVAARMGYSGNSASTVQLWEKGTRPVRTRELARLADLYGIPVTVFTHPEPSAFERLDELALDAGALAREDSEREPEDDPGDEDEPSGGPGTRPQ